MKRLVLLLTIFTSCILILSFSSCDQSTEDEKPENRNPFSPILSYPDNKSEDIELDLTLKWQQVTDPDGDQIKYAVFLDTNANPTTMISSSQTSTSFQTTLESNSMYYWKISADDGNGGTSVSSIWSFSTINTLPTDFTLISPANGMKDADLDSKLVWSASSDPVGGNIAYDVYFGSDNPPAEAVSLGQSDTTYLPILQEETTYFWKIIAKNETGGARESDVWNFTTKTSSSPVIYGTVTDPRDGREYKTVDVDGKTWMAENLAYLPIVHSPDDISDTEARYYVYGFDPAATEAGRLGSVLADAIETEEYRRYGVLYNWPAAASNALCPANFHLPTKAEWGELEEFVKGNGFETNPAYALKSDSLWYNGGNGVNYMGLNFLPGGSKTPNFTQLELRGYWWSSSDYALDKYYIYLSYQSYFIRDGAALKSYGMSVRCVHD